MIPEAVIFDCDGVLVDSEPISNAILQADLAARGLPLDHDQIDLLFVGGTMASVGEKARDMGADIPDGWREQIYEKIYAQLRRGTPPVDGVEALLDRLDKAGIPYAVGSNGSIEKMQITLGQNGMIARFAGRIFSAHEVGIAKPEPGLFLIAAEALGVPPDRCAVVDDSPAGCIAARAAGMRCFGYAERTAPERLTVEGAIPVASMSALTAALGLS